MLRNKRWTDAEIAEMDLEEAAGHKKSQATGKRRHYAEAPVVQLVGPLMPILLLGNESSHHPLGCGSSLHLAHGAFIPFRSTLLGDSVRALLIQLA